MIEQPNLAYDETLMSTVRHGLTELNRDKRVGGLLDAPLIEEGRQQALRAKEAFDGTTFDLVISSPLSRAVETAEIITGVGRESIALDDGCIERSFGEMEGLTSDQVISRLPQVRYARVGHINYSLNPPEGETFEQVHERAQRFLERILKTHAGKKVLVFAHENFLQQLHGVIESLDPMESLKKSILNCELNQFHFDSSYTLKAHSRVELCPSAVEHPSF